MIISKWGYIAPRCRIKIHLFSLIFWAHSKLIVLNIKQEFCFKFICLIKIKACKTLLSQLKKFERLSKIHCNLIGSKAPNHNPWMGERSPCQIPYFCWSFCLGKRGRRRPNPCCFIFIRFKSGVNNNLPLAIYLFSNQPIYCLLFDWPILYIGMGEKSNVLVILHHEGDESRQFWIRVLDFCSL